MKKQSLVVLLLLLMTVPCLWAQKKELNEARSYIKSGKDYDKAEKLMTDLLQRDSASRENPKVYLTWYDAVVGQYEAANEKLYFKQAYDTAAFFGLTKRMYGILEALDSVDARPDQKGRIRPKYRERHAEQLDLLRPNLYYGGTWHVKKGNYQQAYDFFDTYIDAASQPLFTEYDYLENDTLMPVAAYWATFCGYKMENAELTFRHCELALNDSSKADFILQYVAEACLWQQDEAAYVKALYRGFRRFPTHPYFFPHLEDYYTNLHQLDSALVVADEALLTNPDEPLFLLAKSVTLLNMERYDECVETSQHLIEVCDTLPEPYFNIATVRLNQALEVEKQNNARRNRDRLLQLYQEACPYMETYRRLCPDDRDRWAPALYRIYLNLNKGKQFEEIDRLMHE